MVSFRERLLDNEPSTTGLFLCLMPGMRLKSAAGCVTFTPQNVRKCIAYQAAVEAQRDQRSVTIATLDCFNGYFPALGYFVTGQVLFLGLVCFVHPPAYAYAHDGWTDRFGKWSARFRTGRLSQHDCSELIRDCACNSYSTAKKVRKFF